MRRWRTEAVPIAVFKPLASLNPSLRNLLDPVPPELLACLDQVGPQPLSRPRKAPAPGGAQPRVSVLPLPGIWVPLVLVTSTALGDPETGYFRALRGSCVCSQPGVLEDCSERELHPVF